MYCSLGKKLTKPLFFPPAPLAGLQSELWSKCVVVQNTLCFCKSTYNLYRLPLFMWLLSIHLFTSFCVTSDITIVWRCPRQDRQVTKKERSLCEEGVISYCCTCKRQKNLNWINLQHLKHTHTHTYINQQSFYSECEIESVWVSVRMPVSLSQMHLIMRMGSCSDAPRSRAVDPSRGRPPWYKSRAGSQGPGIGGVLMVT